MKLGTIFFICLLAIAVCAQPFDKQERKPLTRAEPERAAKAQELLQQTRLALGQEKKLEEIQNLSISGKLRRLAFVINGGNAHATIIGGDTAPAVYGPVATRESMETGWIDLDFSLPEKFRWDEKMGERARVSVLTGEQVWRTPAPPVPTPERVQLMVQQTMRSQFAPLTLGLLLTPPPAFPLEYSYVEEKPFKQTMAEVIAISGPGNFNAELYLDQKTHFPLMLRFVVGTTGRAAIAIMPPGTPRGVGRQALESAKQQAEAKDRKAPQEREKLILFEDYRAENGVLFPHKITTQINGKVIEEISFSKFKVNQPIKAEKFTEKQ